MAQKLYADLIQPLLIQDGPAGLFFTQLASSIETGEGRETYVFRNRR